MPSLRDLTGQTFGDLTVIERAEDYVSPKGKPVTQWLCHCKCGRDAVKARTSLVEGHARSCGQCRKDNINRRDGIDMLNQKFGRLTVIARCDRKSSNGQYYWTCQCECGNIKDIRGDALREGKTLSCGCYSVQRTRETAESRIKDLSGQRFGKLVAVEYVGKNAGNQYKWLCKCDCGNELVILGTSLVQGYTKSCGCINSHGELYTRIILSNYNIEFVQQKTFENLVGIRDGLLSYDFFLPDYNVLIEYQGKQHYEPIQCFGGEEQFKVQQEHDKRKREYAYNNGIRLIEIPYTIDTQEDIELFLQEELAMAFKKPSINKTAESINDISIYLRSVKKWGKSTLFRDIIRVKYDGDLSRGALVECGMETGDTMLNANTTHVDTYEELIELKNWFINEKGKEHNIEMICFDTADELVPIFEAEVIRMHNKENPTKKVKSIKACFGGYNAGVEMAAGMIKKYMSELKKAGFGITIIAHSKFKQIKEKGSLEEDGYMQLTSTLGSSYESIFGDLEDCTLTGVIDRVYDEKDDKKYTTDSVRRLYFRGTNLIDAGGRFANGTVPEYLEYPTNMDSLEFARLFVKTVEDGLAASKLTDVKVSKPTPKKPEPQPEPEEVIEEETDEEVTDDVTEDELVVDTDEDDIFAEEPSELSKEDKFAKVKEKTSQDDSFKTKVVSILKERGVKAFNANMDDDTLDALYALV